MTLISIVILLIIAVLIYWFRGHIKTLGLKEYIILFLSLLGGVFGASILLFILEGVSIDSTPVYSSLIGPFLEEIVKFSIVYFIYFSFSYRFKTGKWGIAIGILVGIGFGVYENFVYIERGVEDIIVLAYRTVFVGGILIHPLTGAIYGYLLSKSQNLCDKLPEAFSKSKSSYDNIYSFVPLVSKMYSIGVNVCFKFIWKLLALDTIVEHIFYHKKSKHGHGPVEIIIESFFLGMWSHVLYNTIITYISNPDFYLIIIMLVSVAFLLRIFICVFDSKIIGSLIGILIASGFFISGELAQQFLMLSLIVIIVVLFFISLELNKRLN